MERLLDYFTPENYNISLIINKETERVRGKVTITGEPKDDVIKLHAENMKISSVTQGETPLNFTHENGILEFRKMTSASLGDISPSELKAHEASDAFSVAHCAGNGRAIGAEPCNDRSEDPGDTENGIANYVRIIVNFSLDLSHNMEGAYVSTYQHDGHEEKLVTTQFESHYARKCFPCIDEPEAKATFDLKITSYDLEDTIISNMPVKEERIREVPTFDLETATLNTSKTSSRKVVEFETTPRMSTYLVAFCMGHFQSKTIENSHGIKVTTYCALNQAPDLLDFPNKIAAEALDYYDDLFGIPYPLPKLDQIAIPDFEAGAMENWGLVTYRESCLLAGKTTAQSTKEYIATVITHELSHQWFGNLVTMKWWDNLWLNESFASVMQYLSVDDLHPDWHIMEDFFTGDCYVALKRDALPGVQAVQQPVNNPEEIATLFDGAIVYAKGAHLIFMLMRLMGRDEFFKGIRDYFKEHQYNNTSGDDLWSALQPYADFDVKDFMDAWISQPGYPVIKDGEQHRFLIDGETDDTKWPLPEVTDDMSGHYLINLTDDEFRAKLDNFETLNLEQRLRLLIDREMLSKTPLVSSASLLDLVPEFRDETSEPVWNIIATILISLKIFAQPDTEYYPLYQQYIYNIVKPQLDRLGLVPKPSEDQGDTKLRELIVGFALYAEDPETINGLAEHYNNIYSEIDPEIRDDVIDAKLKATDEGIFDQLISDYQSEPDPSIRSALLSTFTDAKQPIHTQRLLELLEQPEIVRPQDHIYLFAALLGNHKTRSATYDWLYGHWDYIREMAGDKTLDDYLRVASARIYNSDDAEKFFKFFDPLASDPALTRSISVAHIDISARLTWISRDSGDFYKNLQKKSKKVLAK